MLKQKERDQKQDLRTQDSMRFGELEKKTGGKDRGRNKQEQSRTTRKLETVFTCI